MAPCQVTRDSPMKSAKQNPHSQRRLDHNVGPTVDEQPVKKQLKGPTQPPVVWRWHCPCYLHYKAQRNGWL